MLLDKTPSARYPLPAPTAALPAEHNPRYCLNAAEATNPRSRPLGAARSLLAGRARRGAAANQRAPAEPPPGRAQRPPVQRLLRITAVSGGTGSCGSSQGLLVVRGWGRRVGQTELRVLASVSKERLLALRSALSVCKGLGGVKHSCSLKLHRCFAGGSEEQHRRSTTRLSDMFLNLLLTGQKCVKIGPNVRSQQLAQEVCKVVKYFTITTATLKVGILKK